MNRVVGYLVAAIACTPHARAVTPVEFYGALPRIENVVVSPDGAHLAFVRTEGDERFLAVISLDTGQPVYTVRAGDTKLRAIQWAGNRHMLVQSSVTRDVYGLTGGKTEWSQLIVVDVDLVCYIRGTVDAVVPAMRARLGPSCICANKPGGM